MHPSLLAFLVALIAFGCATPPPAAPPSVAGVWELVELVDWTAGGERLEPFGPAPQGVFVYSPGGRLILHVLADPPPAPQSPPLSAEDLAARARSSIAYFGTWSVDHERGVLVHHVDGALSPNGAGGSYERGFRLDGDELVLDFTSDSGRRMLRRLRRVEPLGR